MSEATAESQAKSPKKSTFAQRCYWMGAMWAVLGTALAHYSYQQRMILMDDTGFTIVRNHQGVWAGYGAVAFAALWIAIGLTSAVRASRDIAV